MSGSAIEYRRAFRGGALGGAFVEVLLDQVLSGMVPLRQPEPLERPPAAAWPEPLTDALNWLGRVPVGRTFKIADGVPVRLLVEAPERRTAIGRHRVIVSARVWRDFMPMVTEDSTRMVAIVSVAADGAGILPPFLRADRIVVLRGDDAWVAPLDEEYLRGRSSREFAAVARLGPNWEPGAVVDIVVRLVGDGGVARLVRLSRQRISRSS
jgi:hypothetical protein